jgi:hypothetical protein
MHRGFGLDVAAARPDQAYPVRAQEAHVLLQLREAAVLAVGHQVDGQVVLLAHRERRALVLVRPPRRHEAHYLRAGEQKPL